MENLGDISKCPFHLKDNNFKANLSNKDWWPKALDLDILHQHDLKTEQ